MKTKQKTIEHKITEFENGKYVKIDGLTYRKDINENSFYLAINLKRLKLIRK